MDSEETPSPSPSPSPSSTTSTSSISAAAAARERRKQAVLNNKESRIQRLVSTQHTSSSSTTPTSNHATSTPTTASNDDDDKNNNNNNNDKTTPSLNLETEKPTNLKTKAKIETENINHETNETSEKTADTTVTEESAQGANHSHNQVFHSTSITKPKVSSPPVKLQQVSQKETLTNENNQVETSRTNTTNNNTNSTLNTTQQSAASLKSRIRMLVSLVSLFRSSFPASKSHSFYSFQGLRVLTCFLVASCLGLFSLFDLVEKEGDSEYALHLLRSIVLENHDYTFLGGHSLLYFFLILEAVFFFLNLASQLSSLSRNKATHGWLFSFLSCTFSIVQYFFRDFAIFFFGFVATLTLPLLLSSFKFVTVVRSYYVLLQLK